MNSREDNRRQDDRDGWPRPPHEGAEQEVAKEQLLGHRPDQYREDEREQGDQSGPPDRRGDDFDALPMRRPDGDERYGDDDIDHTNSDAEQHIGLLHLV